VIILPNEYHPFKRVRLAELLEREFAGKGNNIHWICHSDTDGGELRVGNNIYHTIRSVNNGISIISWISNNLLRYPKYIMIKRVINKVGTDIIIVNDCIIEGFMALHFRKRNGIPVAYYLSSLFYDIDKNEFINSPNPWNLMKYLIGIIKKGFYFHLIKRADIFHPISPEMGRFFKRRYPFLNVYPLPLCPRSSFFNNGGETEKDTDDDIIMICIGQVSPVRKIERLMEILNSVRSRTEKNVRLKIVGRIFKKGYRRKLHRFRKELGLENEVEFIDEVPFHEVPKFIRQSDIGLCILPPIRAYIVSSPTKVLEYLAQGIPVVANSEIVDQREVIEKSGGGLSAGYNSREMEDNILRLIENPEMRREMGRKGREWVLENRNYSILASDLQDFYKGYIEKSGKRS